MQLNLLDDGSASAEKHETRTRLSLSAASNRFLHIASSCGGAVQSAMARSRFVMSINQSIAVRGTQVTPATV